jgi:hypothetical protein
MPLPAEQPPPEALNARKPAPKEVLMAWASEGRLGETVATQGLSGAAKAAGGGADIFVDRPENRRTVTRLREALLSLFSALERAMDLNSKAPLTLLTTRDQHSLDERATSVALPVSENTLRQGVR